MHHVKIHLDPLNRRIRLGHVEPSLLGRAVNRNKVVKEIQRGIVFFNIFHQRRHIVLDPKEHTTSIVETDVDILKHACP